MQTALKDFNKLDIKGSNKSLFLYCSTVRLRDYTVDILGFKISYTTATH